MPSHLCLKIITNTWKKKKEEEENLGIANLIFTHKHIYAFFLSVSPQWLFLVLNLSDLMFFCV